MTKIIDADAARLAGLQIDLLQKFRSGRLGFTELEMFLKLSPKNRANRFGDWKQAKDDFLAGTIATPIIPPDKFALLCDLGVIEVPTGYDHATALASFKKANCKKFYYYNDDINDSNFPNPSRVLKAGDRLRVRAFHQIVVGETSSTERMDFLRAQPGNVFTGAQGAALVFTEKRKKLPKGKWYTSFDEEDRLYLDADLGHQVPRVYAGLDAGFRFDLGYLGYPWHRVSAFLCFCDESLET